MAHTGRDWQVPAPDLFERALEKLKDKCETAKNVLSKNAVKGGVAIGQLSMILARPVLRGSGVGERCPQIYFVRTVYTGHISREINHLS